jgi:hypothetical protein
MEHADRLAQVRTLAWWIAPDLALGRTVPTCLGTLEDTRDIFSNRVRSDERI